jgi:predicted ABC-type transport system involved in lysophospholipase L1 biosynthesis ATPase subunit
LILAENITKVAETGTHRVDILKGIDLEIQRGEGPG